ncbi:DUF1398 domain-containing protein [Dyella jiangningensis]|uniref:Phage envelope protein n=1 Tax=Dyella jiangningensis TaxID=1379159 RepID=A0A328P2X9_9GAMM|nr:DUF1398 family protein [Dyella jiangningensis]RAO75012.1 hypothetical protein CA260_12910 [Dyella jiangningensis]
MFTLQQIDELHARLGKAKTLALYVRSLHAIGVEHYESYVADGHSEYFGKDGYTIVSPPVHNPLVIADVSQPESFLQHLRRHELGETGYMDMSRGLAESGIEKWSVDAVGMTMTFYDMAGNAMLVNEIS